VGVSAHSRRNRQPSRLRKNSGKRTKADKEVGRISIGGTDARKRATARGDVQLHFSGEASAARASAQAIKENGG
jgi:hypothetical protein